MDTRRQKNQYELAFMTESRGEAPMAVNKGNEVSMTSDKAERPAENEQIMEEVCKTENVNEAFKRVRSNEGSAGIDGMTVEELPRHLRRRWSELKQQLLSGVYQPQPVRRVEIPKPNGGMRNLGIPTVVDRFIQQALLQVLQKRWDATFSEHSYGFRPGKRAHQAVEAAQKYIEEGNRYVVDIDLEKFFDRVNHDKLMGQVAKRVKDKRVLKLIRGYLNAGVMENGVVVRREAGTPQGGPLSPLLSNLYLDELDRELERRGHRFVRYADDCNIYVKSERAGQRVMESIRKFITKKLKLKINESKSAVSRPQYRKFLGFSFTFGKTTKRRIATESIKRFKSKIRRITQRTRGIKLEGMVEQLKVYLEGWRGYFGYCQTPSVLGELEKWTRRRLRSVVWKQWKRGVNRYAQLRKMGIGKRLAAQTAGSNHGPWRLSNSPALAMALSNAYFKSLGLPSLLA